MSTFIPRIARIARATRSAAACLAALLLVLASGPGRSTPALAQVASRTAPADFVVISQASNSVLRYSSDGTPDPAAGIGLGLATFVSPSSSAGPLEGAAFGPDANLYISGLFGSVTAWNGGTGVAIGTFVNDSKLGFTGPIAFGPDFNLYLVNTESGTILRYCGPLLPVCQAGSPFPLPDHADNVFAQGLSASDMTFGPDGNLYTVFGSTVQRFCGRLTPTCVPGDPLPATPGGPAYAAFAGASIGGLAFGPDGNLYLSDKTSASILRVCGPLSAAPCTPGAPKAALGLTGSTFVPAGPNGATQPVGLDFGPDGNLYVADSGTSRILRYFGPQCTPGPCEGTPDPGRQLTGATLVPVSGGLSAPTSLRFPHQSPPPAPTPKPTGGLLVSGLNRSPLASDLATVLQYDAQTAAPVGPFLSAANMLTTEGMALGPDGDLYVAGCCTPGDFTAVVKRFDGITGTFVGDLVTNPMGPFVEPGILVLIDDIVFGPDGNLYAAGSETAGDQVVVRYDGRTGALLGGGSRNAFIANPPDEHVVARALAFGPDGNLYVTVLHPFQTATDTDGAVVRYDGRTGAFIDTFVDFRSSGLGRPTGLTFGPDGNLYVASHLTERGAGVEGVLRFDGRTGAPTPGPGQTGATLALLPGPKKLTFGPDGDLYVSHNGSASDPFDDIGAVARFNVASGLPEPSLGELTDFVGFASGGLHNAGQLLFRPTVGPRLTGGVFKNSVGPANALVGVQVVAGTRQLGFVTCPFAGLLFLPCPTATTDTTGQYALSNMPPGTYVVGAFPPANLNFFPGSITVAVPAGQTAPIGGQNIVLLPPAPLPNGVTVTLADGTPSQMVQGVPVVPALGGFAFDLQGCPGGTARYSLTLVNGPTTPIAQGFLGESPAESGLYGGTVKLAAPSKGMATASVTFHCPDGSSPNISFLLYIDPSGTVVDDATGLGVRGAMVTLLRADTPHGPFAPVPAGSAQLALSNRVNPDQTDSQGNFGWDVVPGYYRLQARAPGHTCQPAPGFTCAGDTVQTNVLAIPPAAMDLKLPLHRTGPAFTPNTTASPSPLPNAADWSSTSMTVSLSAAEPAGGTDIKQTTFSASGAQNISTTSVPGGFATVTITAEGQTTLTYFATDSAGNSEPAHTLIVKVDRTPPGVSFGAATPAANPAGWNNTDVSVPFIVSDAVSGLASTTPVTSPLVIGGEGAALTASVTASDLAGNSTTATSPRFAIDRTPPQTQSTVSRQPNTAGWYQADVTVTLSATDVLSGVARTEVNLDAAGWTRYAGPITLAAEGVHTLQYRSVDRADNTEAAESLSIRIDKTAPEAFLQFDPISHDVQVFGRDSLSGVQPGPVAPAQVTTATWERDDDEGADVDAPRPASTRTYLIQDLAGNGLRLVVKVNQAERELAARVVSVQRNGGPVEPVSRNSARFAWRLAETGALHALEQTLRVWHGEERQTIHAPFDAAAGQTLIEVQEHGAPLRSVRAGLVLIRLATSGTGLQVEL